MINNEIQEKRLLKRYLCDEFFTHSTLQTPQGNLDFTAINFNQDGIGVFSNDFIQESGNVRLSMHYENPDLQHEFYKLPCSIVYCNQTEIGSYCGIHFNLNEISPTDRAALVAIEAHLVKNDDADNRYHFQNDD